MTKRLLGLAALLASWCMGAADASAQDFTRLTAHQPLIIKGSTTTPIGALGFCKARPADCVAEGPAAPVELTAARWRELEDINRQVNTEVVPVTDQDFYHLREVWTYPVGYGDCEDFALGKRRALIELGWPAGTLLMALVRQSNGNAHAVLVASTSIGDLVLDNLVDEVRGWDETAYKFVKMQTPHAMDAWVDVEDDRTLWVASK